MSTESASENSLEKDRQALFTFFKAFPFNQLMGMELVDVEPGRARLSMSWREDLCQPAGILHGGAMASLADTAIAHAILLTPEHRAMRDEHGGRIVSVDLRLKYLRPVSEGKIFCDARVLRMGRQIIHTDAVITTPEGKEIALADSIYMMVTGKQLERRK
jgi:acyl-CoA thioesterase